MFANSASVIIVLTFIAATKPVIIPDELPSILSVIYSNIPTLKKGTDSRLGWGFRFGDRADFQVLVELGPQTNTQPLANQQTDNRNNKRNVPNNLMSLLYAQRQKANEDEQRQKAEDERDAIADDVISDTDGGRWLKKWSKNVVKKKKPTETLNTNSVKAKPGLAIGEIDAKSVIPDDDVKIVTTSTTPKTWTTTPKEEALDNVDMD